MKKIILPVLSVLLYANCIAQLDMACVPDYSIEVLSTIPVEFIPANYTADVWASPSLLEDREVFFIHGLGGQGDEDGTIGISWSQASLYAATEYRINSSRPDYADVSLDFAAAELRSDLEAIDEADDHAIIIGHSQGGIVSRRIDYSYFTGEWGPEPRSFGGLVTFGSSNQGAQVLNNKEELMTWAGTTCMALTAGPVAEYVESNFFLDLFLNTTSIGHFSDFFCGTFENNIAPVLFKDYFSGITESYEVGSEQLVELNAFVPEIPYVCFYGVETEPLMWNTLVHLLDGHEPNNVITYGEDPFGAGGDNTLADYANVMTDLYYSKYISYDNLSQTYADIIYGFDLTTLGCYLTIFCALDLTNDYEESAFIRDSYKEGYDWFMDANTNWKGFIGANVLVEDGKTCYCIDDGPLGDLTDEEYPASPDGTCATEDFDTDCYTTTNYNWIYKESDGVVLAESASVCLGQIDVLPDFSRKMFGSNHFSIRNDSETRQMLDDLFEGNHGLFFATPER